MLGEAFADYPWTRWTVDEDDHGARVTALQRLALEHYGFPFGQVWATLVDDEIRCVAVWMDSGSPATSRPDVTYETARLEGRRREASVAAETRVAPLRPPGRHLYLATIGTLPRHQRTGLASATLAPVLAHADDAHVLCYLETSSAPNVVFYERLGFDVVDHLRIEDDGPDVWAMARPPLPRRLSTRS